jgi:hypothetical protein
MARDPVAAEIRGPFIHRSHSKIPSYENSARKDHGQRRDGVDSGKKRGRTDDGNDYDEYDIAHDKPWPREGSGCTYDRGSKTSSHSSGGTPRARPIDVPIL